jgi:hypothetical protein
MLVWGNKEYSPIKLLISRIKGTYCGGSLTFKQGNIIVKRSNNYHEYLVSE